jgi:hypothetical protein
MRGLMVRRVLPLVMGVSILVCGIGAIALAAEAMKIDGLSKDPKQFRVQVEQLLNKTDTLIAKLRGNPAYQAAVLDLLQTRDDILRELPKVESAPGDAKWTAEEMMESVQSKLKLLKEQYDKASGLAI